MIVSARDASWIYSGRKTEHRIAADRRPPARGRLLPISYREPNPDLGLRRDGEPRTETIQVCRARVLEVRGPVELGDATRRDAQAEGHGSLTALWAAYGGAGLAWVLRLEPVREERPRWLSSGVIAGRQGDYVRSPSRALDEAEAVDEATLAELTRQARDRDRLREAMRRSARARMSFGEQVEALSREARARHIDVRDELRAIERWSDHGARERQLERLRAKLERRAVA